MDNKNFIEKDSWNQIWNSGKKEIPRTDSKNENPFSKIFKRYIKKSNSPALEVGCFPGSFLAYLSRNFGYFPEGIDFTDNFKETCSKILESNGLYQYNLYNEDFLKWKTSKKYGLVCSFGFIEHFDNPEEVVKKHIDLLAPGGTLILEVPNFRGLRHFIAKHTDLETLNKHNMKVMDIEFYKKIAQKYNLRIKYLGYYGRFEYTWLNYHPSTSQKIIYYPFKILSKLTFNYPFENKFLSGWLLFIAEKV